MNLMTLSKVATFSVAAALSFATQAATTYFPGQDTWLQIDGQYEDFAIRNVAKNQSFTDIWQFEITEPVYSTGSLTALNTPTRSFTSFSVQLYSGIYGTPGGQLLDTIAGVPSEDLSVITYSGSGNYEVLGKYYFLIEGTTSSTKTGQYTFFASATPLAPVPEPETYAMLLAGLGVMGAIAARRNSLRKD